MKPVLYHQAHKCFGDSFCACAAAHIVAKHENRTVQVSFWDAFKELATYFDGIEFIHEDRRGEFQVVDVGPDPFFATPLHNGVSRFLRFMGRDSSDTRIEMNVGANPQPRFVSIIPSGNMNRSIGIKTLETMLDRAKQFYPNHEYQLIGHRTDVARYADLLKKHGVRDAFTEDRSGHAIIDQLRNSALLMSVHTGPCFAALGLGIRLWCERSINPLHDYLLDIPNGCPFWFGRQ